MLSTMIVASTRLSVLIKHRKVRQSNFPLLHTGWDMSPSPLWQLCTCREQGSDELSGGPMDAGL